MEKVEYIRTLKTDSKSVLLIFRVLHECYLSEIKLVFEHEDSIRLPKVKVEKGYFIWVTNMEREEVNQSISNNSSNTKTIILQLPNNRYNLCDFKKIENAIC